MLASNAGILTPSSASRPRNVHGAAGSDHGDSNEDSDSDGDGEVAENSDILAAVEEENPGPEVVAQTILDWEEYAIDVAGPSANAYSWWLFFYCRWRSQCLSIPFPVCWTPDTSL